MMRMIPMKWLSNMTGINWDLELEKRAHPENFEPPDDSEEDLPEELKGGEVICVRKTK